VKHAAFFIVAAVIANTAFANDLAEANRLLETRAYAQASAIYERLAAAGNADAQFHLGEMHWYGEGYKADDAAARQWFQKAATAGSKEAAAALETMRLRETRRADIDYYVQQYDGADLAYAKYQCATPDIPASSLGKDAVTRVNKQYSAWQECYNGFVQQLQSAMPAGSKIPKDVADLMNEQEFDGARQRMESAYARLAAEGKAQAEPLVAKYDSWFQASEKLAIQTNERFKADKVASDAINRDFQSRQNDFRGRIATPPTRR